MSQLTMRRYAGPADLRAMQRLTQRIWSHTSNSHIGDQAWQRFLHTGRESEWPTALWESGDDVVAWGWVFLPDHLELMVDPARPALLAEVLDWFATTATATRRTVAAIAAQTHVIAALEQHGYRPADETEFLSYQSRSLAELPEPVLPPGFTARPMRGSEDIPIRLAGNQAAWPGSRITEESYRAVMAAWPYRTDMDWMVEAPNGDAAANCLIWLDEHNRVGLLEPVGTSARYRRMGLGRAVCLAAMHAARAAGAREAVVYPVSGGGHVGAVPLYADLGFTPYACGLTYTTDG